MTEIVPATQEVLPKSGQHLTLPDLDLIEVTHFDGWTPAELAEWLTPIIATFAQSEQRQDAYRRGVGLALWKLRADVGDGIYGEQVRKWAATAGVSERTLRTWRTAAEDYYKLPAPTARTIARRDRAAVESGRTSKQERATEGGDPTGTPTQPGARGGKVAATKKAAEAPTAAPKPARSDTPPAGEDQAPPVPSPPSGPPTDPTPRAHAYPQPTTAGDVRRILAIVETLNVSTLRQCGESARLDLLARRFSEASRPARAEPVTPIPKAARR